MLGGVGGGVGFQDVIKAREEVVVVVGWRGWREGTRDMVALYGSHGDMIVE